MYHDRYPMAFRYFSQPLSTLEVDTVKVGACSTPSVEHTQASLRMSLEEAEAVSRLVRCLISGCDEMR